MKPYLILLIACIAVTSCAPSKKCTPEPIVIEAPDYTPIGDGIKVHSYALIGVAVIIMLGMYGKKDDGED